AQEPFAVLIALPGLPAFRIERRIMFSRPRYEKFEEGYNLHYSVIPSGVEVSGQIAFNRGITESAGRHR
ncbi:MAG: hypothetical protein ACREDR_44100, partial [Blastocatellia bacterium]